MRHILFTILFFTLTPFFASATTSPLRPQNAEVAAQLKIPALFNENRFTIFYAFEDEALNAALKDTLIEYFQRLGTVHLGDDTKLSKLQKEDKYRPGGMIIEVSASQINEGTSNDKLPVFEISLKVIAAAQLLENDSRKTVVIWEKERFVGIIKDKKEFIQKATSTTGSILDQFVKDYQSANPKGDGKKPEFFFFL